jgi:allophanate hydrolase subunit 2
VGPAAVKLASRAVTNNNARAAIEIEKMGVNSLEFRDDKSRFGQTFQTDSSE